VCHISEHRASELAAQVHPPADTQLPAETHGWSGGSDGDFVQPDAEAQGDPEGVGDPLEGAEREVVPASLDPRQSGPGDPDTGGQPLGVLG
jgi:hypothetical protein